MNKPYRVARDFPRMPTTMNMPARKAEEDLSVPRTQGRPTLLRYRLQIDRQTKTSFSDQAEAEKAARAIKNAHPVVQVAIYDAETEQHTVVEK
jgi:hypothetical protein